MDATSFEAVKALHELKQKDLGEEDRKFVAESIEKNAKGELLTRSDILRIRDLIAQ